MKIKKILKETTNRRTYHILQSVDQDTYPEDYGHIVKRKMGFKWIQTISEITKTLVTSS
jgi:hypothetical protein